LFEECGIGREIELSEILDDPPRGQRLVFADPAQVDNVNRVGMRLRLQQVAKIKILMMNPSTVHLPSQLGELTNEPRSNCGL
jgi:hypothetical protein